MLASVPASVSRSLCVKCVLAVALLLPASASAAFDFNAVARKAKALAQENYKAPDTKLPAALAKLSYEDYRKIRFRPDRALWHNSSLPFELQFMPRGMYFNQNVKLNLIGSDGVRQIAFNPSNFSYGNTGINTATLNDLGFSGFRIHYPINREDYKDEVLVFQGATYLRGLGKGQRYGMSARGLAVDTGELSGEEFPQFTEFWIKWPRAEDHELTIYALLDSPRLTGAYRFVLKPGDSTAVAVTSRLFFRADVSKLGVAPLTSMFLFGENQPSAREDYRPEVHDSEGLMVKSDDEWIWRPLVNPRRLFISSFGQNNPRGFGLMQRDRDFAHYEDLDTRYDLRPSAWIEPQGDWGKGRVELVMIPTPDETNDNIVAYWVPERAPRAGDQLDLSYTLYWQMKPETVPPLARVVQTRRGHGFKPADDVLRYQIDFKGGELDKLPPDAQLVAGVWVSDTGELIERQLVRNEAIGGWRLNLRVRRGDETKVLEMRAILRDGSRTISETWAYALPANAGR